MSQRWLLSLGAASGGVGAGWQDANAALFLGWYADWAMWRGGAGPLPVAHSLTPAFVCYPLAGKLLSEQLNVLSLTFYTAPVSLLCLLPFVVAYEVGLRVDSLWWDLNRQCFLGMLQVGRGRKTDMPNWDWLACGHCLAHRCP